MRRMMKVHTCIQSSHRLYMLVQGSWMSIYLEIIVLIILQGDAPYKDFRNYIITVLPENNSCETQWQITVSYHLYVQEPLTHSHLIKVPQQVS